MTSIASLEAQHLFTKPAGQDYRNSKTVPIRRRPEDLSPVDRKHEYALLPGFTSPAITARNGVAIGGFVSCVAADHFQSRDESICILEYVHEIAGATFASTFLVKHCSLLAFSLRYIG